MKCVICENCNETMFIQCDKKNYTYLIRIKNKYLLFCSYKCKLEYERRARIYKLLGIKSEDK